MTAGVTERPDPSFWAVIPAGGAGTRLWPLSRSGAPKFLHDLTGHGRTLLQSTVDRLRPLCGEQVMIVTGQRHVEAVTAQLPELSPEQVLAEPSPRDSMAAIGWAAARIEQLDPEAVIGSFAADHVIEESTKFADCVREAVAVARTGLLVTLGIEPTFPSSGFGYIQLGEAIEVPGAPHAHRVASFVEKPDTETAERYLATGSYRWNAGMFVAKAGVLLDLLAEYRPELARRLRELAAAPDTLDSAWPELEKIAIDHAIAEPAADAGRVAVIPGTFGWDDIGDFASLAPLLPDAADAPGIKLLGADDLLTAVDASGVVVAGSGRRVVALGIDNLVVVDTPDAVLVTTREKAQEVKQIVELLRAQGRTELL